jgi:type IV pilus assembly protein PilB
MAIRKRFLGELLVEAGVITEEQKDIALKEQKKLGKRLGEVLIDLGFVTEETLADTLSKQLGLPFKDIKSLHVSPEVVQTIPEAVARKYKVLPVEIIDGKLTLAMVDPLDVLAMDEIKRRTRLDVEPVVVVGSELLKALDRYYKGEVEEAIKVGEAAYPAEEEAAKPEDTPVVKLVNMMITHAIRERASDIHIEPDSDSLRIRYRIDGILHEAMVPPKQFHPGIVSRIKILSGMDIAEKRVPQDGRFPINIEGKEFDIRTSTLPTLHGEKVVLRLLEKTTGLPNLSELGFSEETLHAYEKLIKRPYGFILATGPTGCGKTTTMYSSLKKISTIEKNVITVEDPIEYNLKGINQVQVNPKAGLTFANGLRSILRQDPDVIMIGEIRDLETASIATHAALTGHLVLSTLHTNEAVGALARLIDMGVEPFLITSSLIGVLGQRLIRKICPHCKESYTDSAEVLKEVGIDGEVTLFRGKGCGECWFTGYFGREGLFELLMITESIKRLIVARASVSEIKEQAKKEGFKTLKEEGLIKVVNGVTTLEEVMRVTTEAD